MTLNSSPMSRTRRLASATALLAAVAAGTTLVAPAASAAPGAVTPDLVLTKAEFPAGSNDYRTGTPRPSSLGADKPSPACTAAIDRVNQSSKAARGFSASARNGYSLMVSAVLTPPQASVWRAATRACEGPVAELPVPGDLTRFNPVVLTYRSGGKVEAIEGVADVAGRTVDVYVGGLSETPANTARFWQVFRAQLQKVERAR